MPQTDTSVRITVRTLIQRFAPVLADRGAILEKARGQHAVLDGGDWYALDLRRKMVAKKYVEPEEVESTMGLIKPFEAVRD
jgi:hypothetical protein